MKDPLDNALMHTVEHAKLAQKYAGKHKKMMKVKMRKHKVRRKH